MDSAPKAPEAFIVFLCYWLDVGCNGHWYGFMTLCFWWFMKGYEEMMLLNMAFMGGDLCGRKFFFASDQPYIHSKTKTYPHETPDNGRLGNFY